MGKLPGFEGLDWPLHVDGTTATRFMIEPPLRLAFFGLHLNSTDGDTTFALDLAAHRIVRLSRNWATPIPLSGEPEFLALTYVRYLPILDSEKTANCSYLDRWDANLVRVRYARDTAAIFHGASMYCPGKIPATVTILGSVR